MKMKEVRELADESLATKVKDLDEEMFNLKFQHGIRPLENTAKLSELKKDRARIKTVIKERQLISE
jgi:large subunit ribosomal protein L29